MAMFRRFLFYLFAILTCLSYFTEICHARGGGGGRGGRRGSSRTSGSSRRTPTQNDHPGGNHGLSAVAWSSSWSSPGSSRGGRVNTGGYHGSSSSSSTSSSPGSSQGSRISNTGGYQGSSSSSSTSSSPGSSRGGRVNTGGYHGSSSWSSSWSPFFTSSQDITFIILLSLSPLFIFWLIAAVFCCCKAWYNPKEKLALANEKKKQEKSGILTGSIAQGKSAPVKMYSAVQTELDQGPTKVTTQSASTESLPLSDETGMGTVDGQKK